MSRCSYLINCFDQKDEQQKYYEVDYFVYVYIKQLEIAIRFKDFKNLNIMYPDRFKDYDGN